MVLILGADSYIGSSFCVELHRRGRDFALPRAADYSDFNSLFACVRKIKPEFVVNAAGCAGKDVDVNDLTREDVLRANTILPHYVAQVCLMTNTPWGHVSSCDIYSGAKVVIGTGIVVEKKIKRLELLRMMEQCPEKLRGFTETDEPNFSFRSTPCSFFSGTVALAEEAVRGIGRNYIWRLGQTFDQWSRPGNLLRQILHAEKIHNGVHAYSHTGDFARACLDLWERDAPFGIYNVANPGWLTTAQIGEIIQSTLRPPHHFEFREDETDLYAQGNRTLHSNYVLDVSRLLASGVAMRPAMEAIEESLKNWRTDISGEMHQAAA